MHNMGGGKFDFSLNSKSESTWDIQIQMYRHATKIADSTAMESNQNDKNLMRLA